jgi:hypothetical protein
VDIVSNKFFAISAPYISSQSKGCLVMLQFRHTFFYLYGGNRGQAPIEIQLFAPRQTHDKEGTTLGYVCKGFFLRIGTLRFSLN